MATAAKFVQPIPICKNIHHSVWKLLACW
jgi:hypothetical protein